MPRKAKKTPLEHRLSFRITPEVSDYIDNAKKKYDNIKDRSDFGSKAVNAYMEYLELESKVLSTLKKALYKIAEETGMSDLEEIQDLKELDLGEED